MDGVMVKNTLAYYGTDLITNYKKVLLNRH